MNSILNTVLREMDAEDRQKAIAQRMVSTERRRWEDDPAKPANLLAHLQRFSVPDKKREKLAANATLEKVEASIPEGDPRKGLGLEALTLTRELMPKAPRNAHPQDILEGVFNRLSAERSEATNLYIQKEESGLFGRKDIPKPAGYEEWKGQFIKSREHDLEFTNPLVGAAVGAGAAIAGEGIKKLLAKGVGEAGAGILDPMTGKAVPRLSEILASGERVATKAFVGEGLGLTGLGRAASNIPWAGKKIANWALGKGGASIGTKIIGRYLMASPPVGPVGIGMKIAGAALMAIPDTAMWDIGTHLTEKAAPEWSAQRDFQAGLVGGVVAAPGMMALTKGLGKLMAAKEAASVTGKELMIRPSGDNMLATWKAQEGVVRAEEQQLLTYRALLDDREERFVVKPPSRTAQEDFYDFGKEPGPGAKTAGLGTQSPTPATSGLTPDEVVRTGQPGVSVKGLPLPESLKGKMLGEGFVGQDIVNTHIYNYKAMLKDFTDDLITTGRDPGEALSMARQSIKRGIGLELINSATGNMVSGMPMKMRLLGPHGVESVFHEVTTKGTDLATAVENALITRQQFGKDVFKTQVYGINPKGMAPEVKGTEKAIIESTPSMVSETDPAKLAQKNGIEYLRTMDYTAANQGIVHYFNDPLSKNSTIGVRSLEELERTVAESRARFAAAEKTALQQESFSKTLETNMAQETSKIESSGLDRVKAARGAKVTPEEATLLEDQASKIDDQIVILQKKKVPDTAAISALEKERDALTKKATPGIEEVFSRQPPEAILKGEATKEMHSTLDQKMELYRKDSSKLSDEDFMVMHNAESTTWHTPEATARYKRILDEKRTVIPKGLDEVGKQILDELGPEKAGKVFDKAGKSYKKLGAEGVEFLKDEGLKDEDIKLRILHEVTKGKYISLLLGGLVAGGTMVALPDDVLAGAPDLAGRTVLKAVAEGAKGWKGSIMDFAKGLKESGLLSPKISDDGLRVENFQRPIIVVPDFDAINRKKKLPFGLDRILSPYTLGQIYYSGAKTGAETMSNPAVGLASAQTAAENNTASSLQVFYNIMKNFGIAPAFKEVRAGMKDLSSEFQPIISATAAHYKQATSLRNTLKKAEKSLKKASGEEAEEISIEMARMKEQLDVHTKAIDANKEGIAKFHTDYDVKLQELAKKHASVRTTLLMEEEAGKDTLYPWLREYAQPNEYHAAARMKEMMKEYAGRMMESGQDPITYKGYVHYAAHPDTKWGAIDKVIEGIQSGAAATPSLIKFYERSIGGRNFMPDIFYSMERYLPDANRRIAFGDFWGKGRKNSWYSHANSMMVQSNEGLKTFWDVVERNFHPVDSTRLARISDRIQAFEVARLLAMSPSVSFKHAIKLEATWSNMGWIESMKAMPETTKLWARRMTPERFKGNPTLEDQVFKTFINQGAMARTIADMETAAVPNNLWDKATTWFNEKGAIMVNSVENFDRAHSMVAAGMMAAKQGMTAAQASYGVMDSILKNNFLTGAMNPSWLRDPKVRLMFLFQGTPFKIAEQRAINLLRSGKAVKRAATESLDLMRSLKGDVKEGEFILKAHAIKDALLSEKDIWGTPLVQQTMRKIMVLGSMIATGKVVFDSDLWNHVIHAPFLEFGKKDVSVRFNPLTSATYKTWQERGEEDKSWWMVDDFMKNWIRDPFVQNNVIKAMRLSKNDIPEIYKDSRVRYMLSVPGEGE